MLRPPLMSDPTPVDYITGVPPFLSATYMVHHVSYSSAKDVVCNFVPQFILNVSAFTESNEPL